MLGIMLGISTWTNAVEVSARQVESGWPDQKIDKMVAHSAITRPVSSPRRLSVYLATAVSCPRSTWSLSPCGYQSWGLLLLLLLLLLLVPFPLFVAEAVAHPHLAHTSALTARPAHTVTSTHHSSPYTHIARIKGPCRPAAPPPPRPRPQAVPLASAA